MKKKLLIFYIIFIIYTVFVLSIFNGTTLDLSKLFLFEGDWLLIMIFNSLGILPIYYILFLSKFKKQKWYVYVLFVLGFMFGAFAIVPGLLLLKREKNNSSKIKQILFIILPIILILMLFSGLVFGNLSYYFDLFLSDSFVNIMTIDYIFLISIPYMDDVKSLPFLNLVMWQD